jgi:hypothetical protein
MPAQRLTAGSPARQRPPGNRHQGHGSPGRGSQGHHGGQHRAAVPERRFPRWAWLCAAGLAAIVAFACYLRLASTYPATSDGADQALQAWDALHGNLLLHGWTVGDVSYYSTEIPEYMLIELVHGLGPGVVHIGGAITYTLLILLAAVLAKGRATGREGVVRAVIAVGIMLAPQLGNGVHLLISQPDHLGTQVPLLAMFIVVDRAPRRWYVPVLVAVVLSWVIVGDQVAIFDAALPLAAVCGLRVAWALIRHREPLASQAYELSLAAAGLVSLGGAAVAVTVIGHLGGYTVLPLKSSATQLQYIPKHLVLGVEGILNIYGADFFHIAPGVSLFGPGSGSLSPVVATAVAIVHLVGVGLALLGFFLAFRRFFSAIDLIAPVLAAGIVINLAAYLASIDPDTLFDTREVLAVLPFGAVLAGRMLGGSLGGAPGGSLGGAPRGARLAGAALAGVLACYALAFAWSLTQPAVDNNQQPVIGWLESHHLTTGLGTYTEANLITLDSGGRVAVRTATWEPTGAVPRAFESKASWYDPSVSYANFIISNTADGSGVSVVPAEDVRAFAGPPVRTYRYKTFTIMVWNKNLLADLGGPPSAKPGNIP